MDFHPEAWQGFGVHFINPLPFLFEKPGASVGLAPSVAEGPRGSVSGVEHVSARGFWPL